MIYFDDDDVKKSDAIVRLTFKKQGVAKTVTEVGTSTGGFFDWVKKLPEYQRVDTRVVKTSQCGPSKTHFRVVDKKGIVVFEPHDPPIKSLGTLYVIWYNVK